MIGVLLCGSGAALLAILFHNAKSVSLVPLWFIAVLLAVAMRFGFIAGAAGSVLAAIIFAIFLFQPYGSLAVDNISARGNLAWMVLGGLVSSYLLGPRKLGRRH